MRKLFKITSDHAKFKKIERRINKGLWHFVLKYALFWGVSMALGNLFFGNLLGQQITTQRTVVTLVTNLVVGMPLGFFMWNNMKQAYLNQKTSWKLGAWGTGLFDDDIACDVIETAIHKDQSIDILIAKALPALHHDTISCGKGYEIIAACAMSHALLNKVSYREIDDLDAWLAKQNKAVVLLHKQKLVKTLQRVLSDQSDLNELWSENKQDYPAWRSNIEELVEALSAA